MNLDVRRRELRYIVVRNNGGRQTVFVRFEGKCVVVSDDSFRDAKLFVNEINAKETAYKLNSGEHGDGGWYVREYWI